VSDKEKTSSSLKERKNSNLVSIEKAANPLRSGYEKSTAEGKILVIFVKGKKNAFDNGGEIPN